MAYGVQVFEAGSGPPPLPLRSPGTLRLGRSPGWLPGTPPPRMGSAPWPMAKVISRYTGEWGWAELYCLPRSAGKITEVGAESAVCDLRCSGDSGAVQSPKRGSATNRAALLTLNGAAHAMAATAGPDCY